MTKATYKRRACLALQFQSEVSITMGRKGSKQQAQKLE